MKTSNKGPNNKSPQKFPNALKYLMVAFLVLIIGLVAFNWPTASSSPTNVSYSQFLQQVEDKEVDDVVIQGNVLTYTMKGEDNTNKKYTTTMIEDPDLVNRLLAGGAEFEEVPVETSN
ncbi:MAG: ATP-dependent metallopeptidase FtsH/Yme1/Tma family protein, partial [Allobaculum sp.]|nr:ATP-dependent metallopeptidase FtsH/Yme1/Tma family protein [Allobaculum sp.]